MITSPTTKHSTSLLTDGAIPEGTLAYYEQRALSNFYSFVLRKFLSSNLKKADLARRIGFSQPQLNRYLASPGNWTIATVQRLLLGIANEEACLTSQTLLGKQPQNRSVLDLLDEEEDQPLVLRFDSPTTATTSNAMIRPVQIQYAED